MPEPEPEQLQPVDSDSDVDTSAPEALASPQPSVIGTWDQSVQIRRTGGNSFTGVVVSPSYTEATSGCVFAPGRQVSQM